MYQPYISHCYIPLLKISYLIIIFDNCPVQPTRPLRHPGNLTVYRFQLGTSRISLLSVQMEERIRKGLFSVNRIISSYAHISFLKHTVICRICHGSGSLYVLKQGCGLRTQPLKFMSRLRLLNISRRPQRVYRDLSYSPNSFFNVSCDSSRASFTSIPFSKMLFNVTLQNSLLIDGNFSLVSDSSA